MIKRVEHLLFKKRVALSSSTPPFSSHQSIYKYTIHACLIMVGLIAIASTAFAAPTQQQLEEAARQADQIQRDQRGHLEKERAEELLKRPRTTIEVEKPEPSLKAGDGLCREVKQIIVEGATLLSNSERNKLTAPYIGTCMTVHDIEVLLSKITKLYIDKGYASARVYIQPQDLATGTLRILVVEGVIEKLMLEGGDDNSNVNLATAFPRIVGEPLNLRDIEQGLDQINRLASNNATMAITPGEKAGGSIVIIRNQPSRRLRGNLSYDNQGATSTGQHMASVSASLDNPLRLNDSVNVSHRRNADSNDKGQNLRSTSFMYSVPAGYLSISMSYVLSEYASTVTAAGGNLIASGESRSGSLSAEYLAYRDRINRVTITGTLANSNSKSYLEGQLLSVSSRILSSFDLGARLDTRLFDGVLGLNLDHVWGLKAFNALRDPVGLPSTAPHAQFRKWKGGVSWMRPFQIGGQNFSFDTSLSGQISNDVLYGSEQFSIGGLYTVRGYRDTSIAGDRGFYWRNTFSMFNQVHASGVTVNIKPYIGYDYGLVWNHHTVTGGRLLGMAAGVNVSASLVNLDVSAVKPVSMPNNLKDEGLQWFAKITVTL